MCKKLKSRVTITISGADHRKYSVTEDILVHWAARLQDPHMEILESSMKDLIDRLGNEAEAEHFAQPGFF